MPDAVPDPVSVQPVVAPLTNAALILVGTIEPGGESAVRDVLPDLATAARSLGFRFPDADLACVAGFGSSAWDRLFSGPRPAHLHPFPELRGPLHHAPATPGDVLLHIRAERMDVCYAWAAQLLDRLGGALRIVDETHGFRYLDHRDLLGFVDGTENPVGDDARAAALVGAGDDPDFEGGSYVVVQKYLHDLTAWNALTVEEQERVIGRTKLDDVEFPDEDKPADSHLALNTVTDPDGRERDILRANMPFGSFEKGESGTYFIGYAADPDVTERMLRNMFLGDPPGTHDRAILELCSTAVRTRLPLASPRRPNGFIGARVEYTKDAGGRRIALTHAGAQTATRTVLMPDAWPLRIGAFDPDGVPKDGPVLAQDIAGPCCFAGDVVAYGRELPELAEDDVVVLYDTGAYYFSTPWAYNSLPRPAVYGFRVTGPTGAVTFATVRAPQSLDSIAAESGLAHVDALIERDG
ncbi:Diaminopimelate decarboxylase [Streptomyces badius]